MPATRPNPRLAKIHRNYSVDEIARLYGVHRNTVRAWIKGGLRTVDDRRPVLVLGRDLADFLQRRRASSKRPCGPGEIYCLRCRAPREPQGRRVVYRPLTPTQGNLVGACAACGAGLFRRVSLAKLPLIEAVLGVGRQQGEGRKAGPQKIPAARDFDSIAGTLLSNARSDGGTPIVGQRSPEQAAHIDESPTFSLNSDFAQDGCIHADTPP